MSSFSAKDKNSLRRLAEQYMALAVLPIQEEKRALWTRLNNLDPVRPMVWINEIPWQELAGEAELICETEHPFCRQIESRLRTSLYSWQHLRTDMVLDPVYYSDLVYDDSGFGFDARTAAGQSDYGMGSRRFEGRMRSEADLQAIQLPRITPDWQKSDRQFQMCCELLGPILPVERRGIAHMWCAPWDILIERWGIEQLFTDMVERPDFVHRGISRMMDALLARLDQFESLGLLSCSNGNHRVGSGGLGITDVLPHTKPAGVAVTPMDQWGSSTGQIFSDVSPAMHDEFCLQYELRWLERFGLNCYGCCEPLHQKMHLVRKIPRLRRVSMSMWIDLDKAVDAVGTDFIFSYKPNPALFARPIWHHEEAMDELRRVLQKTRGCVVEIIMKDISTCFNDPARMEDWCQRAVRLAEETA